MGFNQYNHGNHLSCLMGQTFNISQPSGSEEDFVIFAYAFLWFIPNNPRGGSMLNKLAFYEILGIFNLKTRSPWGRTILHNETVL